MNIEMDTDTDTLLCRGAGESGGTYTKYKLCPCSTAHESTVFLRLMN